MWNSLLWKDFRQVAPAVGICLGLILFVQLLLLRTVFWYPQDSGATTRVFAIVSQMLIALACVGMMMGNERQNRTLDWMSSIPIRWRDALLSQLIVATICVGVTAFITLAIAEMTPWDNSIEQQYGRFDKEYWLIGLLTTSELFLFALFFVLLLRETLTGLIVGALAAFAVNMLTGSIADENSPYRYFSGATLSMKPAYYGLLLATHLLLLVGIAMLYRWRWTLGQHSTWLEEWKHIFFSRSMRFSSLSAVKFSQPNSISARDATKAVAGPFRTLTWQTCRQYSIFYGIIAVVPWLLSNLFVGNAWVHNLIPWTIYACFAVGLSCFVKDHGKQRYRFLSDRGVSPQVVFWSRTLPGLVVCLMMLGAGFLGLRIMAPREFLSWDWQDFGGVFLGATVLFFFGNAASLCFQNIFAGIAVVHAVGILLVAVSESFFNNHRLGHNYHADYCFQYFGSPKAFEFYILLITGCSVLLTIAVYIAIASRSIVPNWLQVDRSSVRRGMAFMVATAVSPVVISIFVATIVYARLGWTVRPSQKYPAAEIAAAQPKPWSKTFLSIERPYPNFFRDNEILPSPFFTIPFTDLRRIDARELTLIAFEYDAANKIELDDAQRAMAIRWLEAQHEKLADGLSGKDDEYRDAHEMYPVEAQTLQAIGANYALLLSEAIDCRDDKMLTQCIECLVTIQALSELIYPSLRWKIERDWLQQIDERCSVSNLRWFDSVYPLREHIKPPIVMKELVDARRYALERALAWEAALDSNGSQIGFDLEGRYVVQDRKNIERQAPWYSKWNAMISDRYAISNAQRHIMAEVEMLDQLIAFYSIPANIETRPEASYFPYMAHIRSKNGATNPEPQNIVSEVLWNRKLRQNVRDRLKKL